MSRFVIALALTAGLVIAASEAAVADGPNAYDTGVGCQALWGYAQDNCDYLTGGRGW